MAIFVVATSLWPTAARAGFARLLSEITTRFGWLFILSVGGFLIAAIALAVSPFARIRLGPDDAEPEFSLTTWLAMLFAAGMGIGLVFFGVAEPLTHFAAPLEATPHTTAAAQEAMVLTFFHWGLHAWAIYAIVGMTLAYFCFRRGRPLAPSSALEPLIGRWAVRGPGKAVDVLAVFGTLFGLATSLGLGAMQVNAGLAELFGLPKSITVQLVIIACITAAATASVVSGLHAGVRRLSEANMILAAALLVFVLAAGPTALLLDCFVDNLGHYLQGLVQRTFSRAAWRGDDDWHARWTLFYWAWWISWAPFVGTFIARISRGRTIREFVAGVVLVPSLLTFVWLTVFGDTALWLELRGGVEVSSAVAADASTAIYVVLRELPGGAAACLVTTLVVILFFVTSSDSGSLVVDMLSSDGDPNPPIRRRVFWAVSEGVVAAVLLAVGGLESLQAAAIATGLPFCVVVIAMLVGLVVALRRFEGPELERAPRTPRSQD
ncbi:Glycine betaine transporter OpuD [Enhygromyxa salina]|uniref:Glycine betaine transporter OpuD n=1 Tax=Enhygromyxa salina TaxID=215803 RepID=A0A109ZX68_9BACT|nr:high affinity choline uptake protein BetT [Enhygromyxa salina]PRQ09321.1 Glycine betaine transporter OpuD [Enhygromyxa salina]